MGDPVSGDVLRQVAPVGPDVAERRRRAALLGVEAPGVVGVLQQPILKVMTVHEVRRADVASRDGVPRLLHERVAAVVERDGRHHAGPACFLDELLRFARRHRQRLVRDDVLAFLQGGGRDFVMQMVGRGVVHDVHVGIVDERLVAAVSLPRAERLRLLCPRCFAAAGHGDDVDEAETPDGVHMVRPDEAGAHDSHSDTFHAIPPMQPEIL